VLLPSWRSPRLLTQFLECLKMYYAPPETSVKYLPSDTSYHTGRLSHINPADRTSNLVVLTLKIAAPSSFETSVFTSWHLLPSWKTKSYQRCRQNIKFRSFNSKNRGTQFLRNVGEVSTIWHLLSSWKTNSYQPCRQNVKFRSFDSKNSGTQFLRNVGIYQLTPPTILED